MPSARLSDNNQFVKWESGARSQEKAAKQNLRLGEAILTPAWLPTPDSLLYTFMQQRHSYSYLSYVPKNSAFSKICSCIAFST
jgi:hypothetical protein